MLTEQQIIEIEKAAEATYANQYSGGGSDCYIVNVLYFAEQTSHLAEAKEILERSNNLYAQQLAVRYFRLIVRTKWGTLDAAVIKEMTDWLCGLIDTRFDAKTFSDIATLIGFIYKMQWSASPDVSKYSGGLTEVISRAKAGTHLCCLMLCSFVDVFLAANDDPLVEKSFMIRYEFSRRFAFNLFEAASNLILSQAQTDKVRQIGVKLMNTMLGAIHLIAYTIEVPESAQRMSSIDSSYASIVCKDEFFDALFVLFERMMDIRILQILCVLCCHSFDSSQKTTFSKLIFAFLRKVFNVPNAFSTAEMHGQICRLLFMTFATKCTAINTTDDDHLNSFMNLMAILFKFTTDSLNAGDWSPHAAHYLVQVWAQLSGIAWSANQQQYAELITSYSDQVVFVYMKTRLAIRDFTDAEEGVLIDEWRCFAKMFFVSHEANMRLLLSMFDNPPDEIRLTWAIHLSSAVFLSAEKPSVKQRASLIDAPLITAVVSLLKTSAADIAQHAPHLSSAICFFLVAVVQEYISCTSNVEHLKPLFADNKALFHCLLHHAFLFLYHGVENVQFLKFAVALFQKCASQLPYRNSLVEGYEETMFNLIAHHNTIFQRYNGKKELYEVRRNFYNGISNLISYVKYKHLRPVVLSFFESGSLSLDSLNDLRGIVEGAQTTKMYAYMYRWLMANGRLESMLLSDPTRISPIVKMLIKMATCFEDNITTKEMRISFITVFEHLSRVFTICYQFAQSADGNNRLKLVKLLLKITSAVFDNHGMLPYLQTMRYYNNEHYNRFISVALRVLSLLSMEQLVQYQVIHESFYALTSNLIAFAPEEIIAEQPPDVDVGIYTALNFVGRTKIENIDISTFYTQLGTLCKRVRKSKHLNQSTTIGALLQLLIVNLFFREIEINPEYNKALYQCILLSAKDAESTILEWKRYEVMTPLLNKKEELSMLMIPHVRVIGNFYHFVEHIKTKGSDATLQIICDDKFLTK